MKAKALILTMVLASALVVTAPVAGFAASECAFCAPLTSPRPEPRPVLDAYQKMHVAIAIAVAEAMEGYSNNG